MSPDICFETYPTAARSGDIEITRTLVRKLLADLQHAGAPEPETVVLSPLAGARASQVFRLTPLFDRAEGPMRGTPLVVKFVSLADGLAEQANYTTFVRPFLPAARRPELHGLAIAGQHAALCYAFIGTADRSSATLTDFFLRGDIQQMDSLLRGALDHWYSEDMIRQEGDLARRYLDRFFSGRRRVAEAEATLSACATSFFGAQACDSGFSIAGEWLPSPNRVLFEGGCSRPLRSCIIHGDLNSDNIVFADNDTAATLVDFRETGRGHVFEDLVSLELSVRINFAAGNARWPDVLDSERRIAAGDWRHNKYASAIGRIRDAASYYFGSTDDGGYQYSLAAIGLRVLLIPELTETARARVAASTLLAAKSLTIAAQSWTGLK
jgi:hypothetical protein